MPKYLEKVRTERLIVGNGAAADYFRVPLPLRTLGELREDHRLRVALKKAVNRDLAPQHLIDAIREQIRG